MSNPLRPDLPPLPYRIAALPVDARGYPVPYFVPWFEGRPEFRAFEHVKRTAAIRDRLCWVCGQPLGRFLAFVVGPMCVVNRISSEPASHLECAEFSVRACPFLSKPQMTRRENDREGFQPGPGVMILRNPGVVVIYTSRSCQLVGDCKGGFLVQLGEPEHVTWWTQGRPATRAEALASMEDGLPALIAAEIASGSRVPLEELQALLRREYEKALRLLPSESISSAPCGPPGPTPPAE